MYFSSFSISVNLSSFSISVNLPDQLVTVICDPVLND